MALFGGWYTLGFTKSDHTEAFLLHFKPNVKFHQNSSSGVMITILGGCTPLDSPKMIILRCLWHCKPDVNFHQNVSTGVMINVLSGWYNLGVAKSDHTDVFKLYFKPDVKFVKMAHWASRSPCWGARYTPGLSNLDLIF